MLRWNTLKCSLVYALVLGVMAGFAGCDHGGVADSTGGGSGAGKLVHPMNAGVTAVTPAGGTLGPLEPIVITFNTPMDPETLSLSDSLWEGSDTRYEWSAGYTVLTITPERRWKGGAGRVLAVYIYSAGQEFLLEGGLKYDVPAEVTVTGLPQWGQTFADTQAFHATFSVPMDPASFAVVGRFAGKTAATWSASNTQVTLTPSTRWPHVWQEPIQFTVNSAEFGEPIRGLSGSFIVKETTPSYSMLSGRYLAPEDPIVIRFGEPMDPATLIMTYGQYAVAGWSDDRKTLTLQSSSANGLWPVGKLYPWFPIKDAEGDSVTVEYYQPVTVVDPANLEDQRLPPPVDAEGRPYMIGTDLAIDGDVAVVSSYGPLGTATAYEQSLVFIYRHDGTAWHLEQTLTPADPQRYHYFGYAVAISGDTIAIGAPGDAGDAEHGGGAVYLFERGGNGWTERTKLKPAPASVAGHGTSYGAALGLHGDDLIVGAPSYPDPTNTYVQGMIFPYRRSGGTWVAQPGIRGSRDTPGDAFGKAIALHQGVAVVSAPDWMSWAGQAYAFARDEDGTWRERAVFQAVDAIERDEFGYSVAVHNGTIVVGARKKSPSYMSNGNPVQGALYVYVPSGSTWVLQQKVKAQSSLGGYVGASVAIQGDTIVAGATTADPVGLFIFTRSGTTWTEATRRYGVDAPYPSSLGSRTAFHGTHILSASWTTREVLAFEWPPVGQ